MHKKDFRGTDEFETTACGNNIQTMTDNMMVWINWSAYLLVYKRPF